MSIIDRLETGAVDTIAKIGPWLSPAPVAFLTARACALRLGWPLVVAIIGGLVIEVLGLSAIATALTLRSYNAERGDKDPAAPVGLALGLVGLYFLAANALTVLADVVPGTVRYLPALFPTLSIAGMGVLGLRSDHRRRTAANTKRQEAEEAEKERKRQERRDARQVHKMDAQHSAQGVAADGRAGAQGIAQIGAFDAINRTRAAQRAAHFDALLSAYQADPDLGATEAARLLGVHRNTVYNYTEELQAAGRLKRNGNGWEVQL